jgi:serine protease inhibitor
MEDFSNQPQISETDMLKANLGFKDHEIFMLRSELEHRNQEHQLLLLSIERLEKTMAACYDRLIRRIGRMEQGCSNDESRKRKRRCH